MGRRDCFWEMGMSARQLNGAFEVRFTRDEAELIRNDPLADDAITEQLRNAVSASDESVFAVGTLDDLEQLLDSVAASANHCEDAELAAHLDRLYSRLEKLGRALLLVQDAANGELRTHSTGARRQRAYILQFRIELLGINPPIWRRIQVSSESTFWDLHVAIQDAIGWQDYHLHQFRFLETEDRVGIPLDDDPSGVLPGWEVRVDRYLTYGKPLALYEYDFGDSWFHEIRFESSMRRDGRREYPRCFAGARRCPPEDCGGVGGYAEFLKVISNPKHSAHRRYLEWVGGPFDPETFDARKVRFSDPEARLDLMLGDSSE
jgi:hypothetical protein